MKRLVVVSLLSILFSPGSHAKAAGTRAFDSSRPHHGWTKIGPGAPGVWAPVAVDPRATGTIYVASVGGGVRKSTDNGATWSFVNSGLPSAIYALAMDASNADTVYAGGFLAGGGATGVAMFKTTDGGATWTALPGVAGQIIVTLTADPHIPGRVFLGGFGGTIFRTLDGGNTWLRVFAGTSAVTSIVIDASDANTVYASTLGGLLRSTDGGTTWALVSTLSAGPLWGVAMDPADHAVLYVAAGTAGVWRSPNAGLEWHATGALPGVAFAVAIRPSQPQTIFVGTSAGVWESLDAGGSWDATPLADRMTFSIATGPGEVLYAGTTSGIAVSGDFSASWTDPDPLEGGAQAFGYAITVDPNVPGKLFASTLGSTARISTDGGASWSDAGTTFEAREPRKINVDPTDSNRVYAGSFASGLFKSVDGGVTWSRRNFGSGNTYVWVPVVDPVSPNIVYAGTSGEGLFKSADYGETWTQIPGMPPQVQGLTIDPRNHNDIFAATSAGVLRSQDGGQTWSNILSRPAWSITIVGGDSQVVYATTKTAGVFRSLDGGVHWDPINVGITNLLMGRAAPVIVDPVRSDVLYVGSEGGGGVFRSSDGGDTWLPVNLGLSDTLVFGLAADPARPGILYVSGPHGIFVTTTGGK